jgi:transcriptional regulator with XRE-family HTH domain
MLKELIKRFSGMGSGLFRSPKKANELIDEQIVLTMKSISGEFKKDSLFKEIEEERLKISLEMETFIKNYENGEINETVANLTINKLERKYKDLEIKIDELNDVREDIKAFDSRNKEKEQEFNKELQKHKVRSIYEMEKGYR